MPDDSELDSSCMLADGTVAICGCGVFDMIPQVALGERTKSEQLGFRKKKIAPWPLRAVM